MQFTSEKTINDFMAFANGTLGACINFRNIKMFDRFSSCNGTSSPSSRILNLENALGATSGHEVNNALLSASVNIN